jgi:2-haloacid dehalogenase
VSADYDAIFLDADDTILDYPAAERAAFAAAASEFGLDGGAELFAAYRRHNGVVWKRFEQGDIDAETLKTERFRLLFDEHGITETDPSAMSVQYLDALSRQTQMLPGAEESLRILAQRWPLVLVTNGLTLVQRRRFADSGIDRHFRMILISEELGIAKPDPGIFTQALDALSLDPSRVLLAGDSSSSDMPAAANAGMDFCWVNPADQPVPPGYSPRFIVRSLAELPAILGFPESLP